MQAQNISIVGAFVAGLLSFLSPCVLPLIPSYITYITGLSFADLQAEHPSHKVRQQTIIHSLLFIAGFTCVFVILGASASFLGDFLQEHKTAIRRIGGVMIVIFGVHVSGLFDIGLLLGEKKLTLHRKPAGYLGSFVVGVVFAAGWTPCIGPILATILAVAATEGRGVWLLLAYSMGLAIPFFLASLALHQFLVFFKRFKRHIRLFEIITGLFMVVVGILIFTNSLVVISRYTSAWFGE
ncbi:cytochrome c biogenesis protein CcdA [Citrifermentans bemidjiense Bem]|uniref:Cytochrome c biogenesis protein CcdA n=1 Tax=Citrifermentans bemidjiense (strain ATCC BAA-1014 / DSM 16622 / JCM 12645 / Bem) TaxID=404380 RepID=B5EBB2_CITBB|nr:cytochrome c biogenesis protein CcdA [Citrifermentans bemidjiense]ACH40404.1 cytochrome c biogenesis protein CcdA [Citrifermentans bemidjiense Bem]